MNNYQRKADCKLCSAKISIEEAILFVFSPIRNLTKHFEQNSTGLGQSVTMINSDVIKAKMDFTYSCTEIYLFR